MDDIQIWDCPTGLERRLAAALKLCERLMPEESMYGHEPWDLVWKAMREAEVVLDWQPPSGAASLTEIEAHDRRYGHG